MKLLRTIGKLFRNKEASINIAQLEDILLESGLTPTLCFKTIARLEARLGISSNSAKIISTLTDILRALILDPYELPSQSAGQDPTVCLFAGVNGVGKTTSIAKFAYYLMHQNKIAPQAISLAAGDTFRAAAISQLEKHATSLGVKCIKQHDGADPAAVAYDAVSHARSSLQKYVLIDTAGRMNTRKDLIAQLEKIHRIVQKQVPKENIISFIIIDGNSGLNTVTQVKDFAEAIPLDTFILSKYDGSTRGGVIISISQECAIPCAFIGTGENYSDLHTFDKEYFLRDFLSE